MPYLICIRFTLDPKKGTSLLKHLQQDWDLAQLCRPLPNSLWNHEVGGWLEGVCIGWCCVCSGWCCVPVYVRTVTCCCIALLNVRSLICALVPSMPPVRSFVASKRRAWHGWVAQGFWRFQCELRALSDSCCNFYHRHCCASRFPQMVSLPRTSLALIFCHTHRLPRNLRRSNCVALG